MLELAKKLDILGITETHDDGFRGRSVETDLRDSHVCAWCPLNLDGRAGGCGMIISKNSTKHFERVDFHQHAAGRHLEARLHGDKGNLSVHVVHIDPALSPPARIDELQRLLLLRQPRQWGSHLHHGGLQLRLLP